jgi:hypothetical protein
MVRDADRTFQSAALVDPAKPNAFSALERVYKIAKGLVKSYGNVRVFNAEPEHRPQGYESDPRSAVYINTRKGKALCTFSKLQTAVNNSANEAARLMDKLMLPIFGPEQLKEVVGECAAEMVMCLLYAKPHIRF